MGELCTRVSDWSFFLQLVEHHRLAPLAAKGAFLAAVPLPAVLLQHLQERAAANVRETFRYLAELQRILSLLATRGIHATVLKGVPLSYQCFQDVSLRAVGDIDLLIDPKEVDTAEALFAQAAIVRVEPAARLTMRRRSYYARYFKDFTYESRNGFEIDLHWRLVRDTQIAERLMPRDERSRRQHLNIGSMQVEVLRTEICLLYLAVHGALEGWPRWKSLADMGALWMSATQEERAYTWELARATALTAYLQAALLLASDWLGAFPEQGEADPREAGGLEAKADHRLCDYIISYSRRQMMKSNFMRSPAGASAFAMKWHEIRLHPSRRSRIELAARVLFRPRMWETIDLPDALFPLYPFLSPAEWLLFRYKRLIRRRDV